MFDIKKEYVVTDDNKKKAVLIDIESLLLKPVSDNLNRRSPPNTAKIT